MRAILPFLIVVSPIVAAEPIESQPKFPYRTDFANEQLPWYRLKEGEFPPVRSEHRIGGELTKVDVIRRRGQFRTDANGESADFVLLPFAAVRYRNAYADLRDLPIGIHLVFSLYQDELGKFTRVAQIADDASLLAEQGYTARLDALEIEKGRLTVTKQKPGEKPLDTNRLELRIDGKTRFRKGDREIESNELRIGDSLLFDRIGGSTQNPARCSEIWVGAETHKLIAEQQRRKHNAFLKKRGLPAWIDRTEGNKITLTLFGGDTPGYQAMFKDEGIKPLERAVYAAVANEELRTYNPPVDSMRSKILEARTIPTESLGCGGQRWTIEPQLMLEGYRKGRIIRLFFDGWPIEDMPKEESLFE